MFNKAHALLRQMLGPQADFRRNQWEAIEALAVQRRRVLVVERTGWGKSVVYFLSTKLLRDEGAGPTLLVSPLLSLMRNQILAAKKIGIRARTLNSANREEWDGVEQALVRDECDILLISPERLNNERFVNGMLPALRGRIGMFVVDEAHCISDWGHDFRPDYRRIGRMLENLPAGVPVLGTTATANNRVAADVRRQLGENLLLIRGPLARTTLRLQNLAIPELPVRLAWLAENLPRFAGSGIIYCLTVAATERVATWLRSKGISAQAYHGGLEHARRAVLEHHLLDNKLKALVATVALGMGFDKPDLSFVIHFQRPASVVAYYQQVGRAGRSSTRAYGILLAGAEDDGISNYFIDNAFPRIDHALKILDALSRSQGITIHELLQRINIDRAAIETALKVLEVDGAVRVDLSSGRQRYFQTQHSWRPDTARIQEVTRARRAELEQMREYVGLSSCLMEYLARALDDPEAKPCGVCAICQGRGFAPTVPDVLVTEAAAFLEQDQLTIEPRQRWPAGLFPGRKPDIPAEHRVEPGRLLAGGADSRRGQRVQRQKHAGKRFDDELLGTAIEMVRVRWKPSPFPNWVTAVPSSRRPNLIADFAASLAEGLGLPFIEALICAKPRPEQRTRRNSTLQAANALEMLGVRGELVGRGPVLLVDDIIDSGWTLTVAGWLLRTHGSGVVFPFVLARAASRSRMGGTARPWRTSASVNC